MMEALWFLFTIYGWGALVVAIVAAAYLTWSKSGPLLVQTLLQDIQRDGHTEDRLFFEERPNLLNALVVLLIAVTWPYLLAESIVEFFGSKK